MPTETLTERVPRLRSRDLRPAGLHRGGRLRHLRRPGL